MKYPVLPSKYNNIEKRDFINIRNRYVERKIKGVKYNKLKTLTINELRAFLDKHFRSVYFSKEIYDFNTSKRNKDAEVLFINEIQYYHY